jgi:hypothetical protein
MHKKYIKRGSKRFGPYLYKTYRENGKIKTLYVGKSSPEKTNLNYFPLAIICAFLSMIFLLSIYNQALITGKAISLDKTTINVNEKLAGNFDISLKEGEFLPADSIVSVYFADFHIIIPLSELISLSKVNLQERTGEFFSSKTEISGSGRGYGWEGTKTSYPVVSFRLEPEIISVQEEQQQISGSVKYGDEFVYDGLADLIPGSVNVNGNQVGDDAISIRKEFGKTIITTSYKEESYGFGSSYLTGNKHTISLDLSNLNIKAENPGTKTLLIELSYNNVIIESESQTINVLGLASQEMPEAKIQDVSCINCTDCNDKMQDGITLKLTQDIQSNASCINLNVSNLVLDCQGYQIINNATGAASDAKFNIKLNTSSNIENITIKNCIINGSSRGVRVLGANYVTNLTIKDSVFYYMAGKTTSGTRYGMYITNTNSSHITNNSFHNFNQNIYVISSNYNVIENNTIGNSSAVNGIGISIAGSTLFNNITGNSINVTASGTAQDIYNTGTNTTIWNNNFYGRGVENGTVAGTVILCNPDAASGQGNYYNSFSGLNISAQDVLLGTCGRLVSAYPPPKVSKFDGATTNFSIIDSGIANLTLENTTYGRIDWNNLLFVEHAEFDSYLSIGNNSIVVNMSSLPSAVNSSANITLKGIYFNEPRIAVDPELDGTYKLYYDYSIISYSSGNLMFSTTHFSGIESFEQNLSSCGDLDVENAVYYLNNSFSASGTCLNVKANNVTLDCAGFSITGDGIGFDDGISFSGDYNDVTIKNCNISNFYNGIYTAQSTSGFYITNSYISASTEGVLLNNKQNVLILNSTILGGDENQMQFVSNITISNSTLSGNSLNGLYIFGRNITLENNAFSGATALKLGDSINVNIINQPVSSYDVSNTEFLTVEDMNEGKIKYLKNITQAGSNLSADIMISNNLISVDSSKAGLNVSANLTMYGTNALSLADRYPHRNRVKCPASICTELQDSNTYVFNVTGFTNYSVGEFDTLAPVVALISPANASIVNNISQNFRCNATEDADLRNITLYVWNLTALIYTNTTAVTGTFNQSSFNFTLPYEGNFSWNCLARDSVNNMSFAPENWTLILDITAPQITINSPENKTYNVSTILVDISAVGEANIWFFNGTANESYTGSVYRTFQQGSTTLIAYANDTAGNLNQTAVTFFVDSVYPLISITYPQNITYAINITGLNYSLTETNPKNCWYTLDNGITNNTITCGNNATGILSNEGSNTWKVYVNDTAGNVNYSSVTFTVDTTAPVITIVSPAQNSELYAGTTWTLISITTNENAICRYNLTNSTFDFSEGVNFTDTNALSHTFTFSPLADGKGYALYYKCNDSLGNVNPVSTQHDFSVKQIPPPPIGCSKPWQCGAWQPDPCNPGSTQTRTCTCGCSNPSDCYGDSSTSRLCPTSCTHYCDYIGQKQCLTDATYRQCVSDAYGCRKWTDLSCPSGQLCNFTSNQCYTPPQCTEDWSCTDWSECIDKNRTRTCSDLNGCTNVPPVIPKPNETEDCILQQCIDGTLYNVCSFNKPKFCSNGILIDNCSVCGCPDDAMNCLADETCAFECTNDAECVAKLGEGYECKSNKCWKEEKECDTDADCPAGKYCLNGECKSLVKTETETPAPLELGGIKCLPSWKCEKISECKLEYSVISLLKFSPGEMLQGKQERKCSDSSNCLPPRIESVPCEKKLDVRVEREIYCDEPYINIYNLEGILIATLKEREATVDITLGTEYGLTKPPCKKKKIITAEITASMPAPAPFIDISKIIIIVSFLVLMILTATEFITLLRKPEKQIAFSPAAPSLPKFPEITSTISEKPARAGIPIPLKKLLKTEKELSETRKKLYETREAKLGRLKKLYKEKTRSIEPGKERPVLEKAHIKEKLAQRSKELEKLENEMLKTKNMISELTHIKAGEATKPDIETERIRVRKKLEKPAKEKTAKEPYLKSLEKELKSLNLVKERINDEIKAIGKSKTESGPRESKGLVSEIKKVEDRIKSIEKIMGIMRS